MRLLESVAGIGLICMVVVVLIGILDRFVLNIGLPWPEELTRFLLIWLSFLSAALAITTRGHYVIDCFCNLIFKQSRQRLFLQAVVTLVTGCLTIPVLLKAADLAAKVSWQLEPALQLSMTWVYVSMPISLLFAAFFYFVELVETISRIIQNKRSSHTT